MSHSVMTLRHDKRAFVSVATSQFDVCKNTKKIDLKLCRYLFDARCLVRRSGDGDCRGGRCIEIDKYYSLQSSKCLMQYFGGSLILGLLIESYLNMSSTFADCHKTKTIRICFACNGRQCGVVYMDPNSASTLILLSVLLGRCPVSRQTFAHCCSRGLQDDLPAALLCKQISATGARL